jgi:hypothetical protein
MRHILGKASNDGDFESRLSHDMLTIMVAMEWIRGIQCDRHQRVAHETRGTIEVSCLQYRFS